MFAAGDYVVYGQTGICQVMDVTTMKMDGVPKDRLYYVLRPDGKKDGRIYTPVENNKLAMRRMMTKEEAEQLIADIPQLEILNIPNDKLREECYKECLKSCESRELVRMIKTIHGRNEERMSRGKKGTSMDERYIKMAEDSLYGELAVLLKMPRQEVKFYILDRVKRQIE